MTHRQQLELANTRGGRITLHLHALRRDHHLVWHVRCIFHEFRQR